MKIKIVFVDENNLCWKFYHKLVFTEDLSELLLNLDYQYGEKLSK